MSSRFQTVRRQPESPARIYFLALGLLMNLRTARRLPCPASALGTLTFPWHRRTAGHSTTARVMCILNAPVSRPLLHKTEPSSDGRHPLAAVANPPRIVEDTMSARRDRRPLFPECSVSATCHRTAWGEDRRIREPQQS